MTVFRKFAAAVLAVAVIAASSLATSSDAQAKGKHRAPKFGNPMAAMMGGGNPMAMMSQLAKNPMMLAIAMTMIQKMASGGGGAMGGFGPPPMGGSPMFGAPPGGSPFGQ